MDDLGMTRSRQARAVIARVNPAKGMTFDASMCKYRAVPAVAAALGYTVLTAEDERDSNASGLTCRSATSALLRCSRCRKSIISRT